MLDLTDAAAMRAFIEGLFDLARDSTLCHPDRVRKYTDEIENRIWEAGEIKETIDEDDLYKLRGGALYGEEE